MAKIEEIDVNFKSDIIKADDAEFHNCLSEPFLLHGLFEPHKTERFTRLPEYFAKSDKVNDGVKRLMFYTAGARVRFVTDSPYVAIVADINFEGHMPHMTDAGMYGFDMYAADVEDRENSIYKKTFVPNGISHEKQKFEGFYEFDDVKMREITINFPLYSSVNNLYIGLKKGCSFKKAEPYTIDAPVVYYGSSITQGGCCSRPGMVYTSIVSRWLDSNHINLGCSGSDLGEIALAEHIATLKMSAFVCAYGYNPPTVESFEKTYYSFYKTIREKNPDLPIIMMSSPVCRRIKKEADVNLHLGKREVVMSAYMKAKALGDENLYFIDGFNTLGGISAEEATVDLVHPTDLGFYNMAKSVYPVLENAIKKAKKFNKTLV